MKPPLFILAFFLAFYPLQDSEGYYDKENSKAQRISYGFIDRTKQEEFQCIVKLLWFEARSEPHLGIKYVLSVVENRKDSSRYPDTYCKVLFQPKQFSFVHERLNQGLSLKVIPEVSEKKKFDFIRKLAYTAVNGNFESLLPKNVLHYTKVDVNNRWTRKKKVHVVENKHKFLSSKTN